MDPYLRGLFSLPGPLDLSGLDREWPYVTGQFQDSVTAIDQQSRRAIAKGRHSLGMLLGKPLDTWPVRLLLHHVRYPLLPQPIDLADLEALWGLMMRDLSMATHGGRIPDHTPGDWCQLVHHVVEAGQQRPLPAGRLLWWCSPTEPQADCLPVLPPSDGNRPPETFVETLGLVAGKHACRGNDRMRQRLDDELALLLAGTPSWRDHTIRAVLAKVDG